MVAWWRLLLVILAATKHTSCLNTFTTESEFVAMGYFKNSHKLLDTVLNYDYQDTVQELIRAHRADRDLGLGLNRKISKVLDDEMGQDYQQSIESLSPLIGKRRMRSQRMRRDKLNLQGVRSHRAHSLESGRRQRIQPDSHQEY